MRSIAIALLLSGTLCLAQESGDFKPASSNVLDAQFPQVDSNSRLQIRLLKAPDATKMRVNFWSGEKAREDGNATNAMWFFSAAQESTDSTVQGGTKCGTGIMAKMLWIYDPTSDQCLFHDSRIR
jgi:hypothetical protein